MKRRLPSILFTAGLALVACRGGGGTTDDTPGDDNPPGDGSGSNPGGTTVKDVQNDSMPPGTEVTLKGVVVTAIDSFGAKTGGFWVEDADGGEFSGVQVFNAGNSVVAALKVGDIVDISGAQKSEFALSSDTSGLTDTELEPVSGGQMTVTKSGEGTVPDPVVVDALAIGQLADEDARNAEWEKYEGVLIKVTNVAALSNPKCIGSQCTDNTAVQFDLTGAAVVESTLAALPGAAGGSGSNANLGTIVQGDCLGSVTGVVDYFFTYNLLPRSTDEIVTGGTGCALENTPALCTDGDDNDGNGFADCDDNACIVGASDCRTVDTIDQIQPTATPGGVELDDVIVSAIAFNGKDLWVQKAAQAGSNQGLTVRNAAALPAGTVVGSHVKIIGKASEFNNDTNGDSLTEVTALQITSVAGTTVPLPVVGQTAANLIVTATGEPFEGVLVTLTGVKVKVLGNTANFGVGTLTQKGTDFLSDDDIFRIVDGVDTCYSTITGIWTYQVFNDAYGFLPLKAGTIDASKASCN